MSRLISRVILVRSLMLMCLAMVACSPGPTATPALSLLPTPTPSPSATAATATTTVEATLAASPTATGTHALSTTAAPTQTMTLTGAATTAPATKAPAASTATPTERLKTATARPLAPTRTPTSKPSATTQRARPTASATTRPSVPLVTATARPPTSTRAPTQTRPPTFTRVPTQPPPPTQAPAPPAAFHATELRFIPAGVLKMGTPPGEAGDADEKPQHDIQLGAFNIERYEVSNAQYRACVAAGACPAGGGPSNNFPVVNVTWYGADAYCRWIGRRLPNEAEWERAGRGADNWRYSFSNASQGGMHFEWNAIYHGSPLSYCEASCPLQHYDNDVNDGYAYAAPVDVSFADVSKGFGVENMNGNVSEWTSNWFDPNAYTQGYNMSVYGPPNSTGAKVVRGGSWATQLLRLADRNSLAPGASRNDLGFRCAQ